MSVDAIKKQKANQSKQDESKIQKDIETVKTWFTNIIQQYSESAQKKKISLLEFLNKNISDEQTNPIRQFILTFNANTTNIKTINKSINKSNYKELLKNINLLKTPLPSEKIKAPVEVINSASSNKKIIRPAEANQSTQRKQNNNNNMSQTRKITPLQHKRPVSPLAPLATNAALPPAVEAPPAENVATSSAVEAPLAVSAATSSAVEAPPAANAVLPPAVEAPFAANTVLPSAVEAPPAANAAKPPAVEAPLAASTASPTIQSSAPQSLSFESDCTILGKTLMLELGDMRSPEVNKVPPMCTFFLSNKRYCYHIMRNVSHESLKQLINYFYFNKNPPPIIPNTFGEIDKFPDIDDIFDTYDITTIRLINKIENTYSSLTEKDNKKNVLLTISQTETEKHSISTIPRILSKNYVLVSFIITTKPTPRRGLNIVDTKPSIKSVSIAENDKSEYIELQITKNSKVMLNYQYMIFLPDITKGEIKKTPIQSRLPMMGGNKTIKKYRKHNRNKTTRNYK